MAFAKRHLRSIYLLGEGHGDDAGPEALRLARAHREGVLVPPTLVVLASAYRKAIRLAGLDVWIEGLRDGPWDWDRKRAMLEHLRGALRDHPAVVAFSEEIVRAARRHGLVEGLGPGRHLAILPSPVVPLARDGGLLRLHDHVWDAPHVAWAEAIRRVWASLWNDRAFLHRRERHLVARPAEMAVLLRAWLPARRWGVLRHVEDGLLCEVHHRPGPVGAAEDVSLLRLDEARDEMVWTVLSGERESEEGLSADDLQAVLRMDAELERVFAAPQDFVWLWQREAPCLLSAVDSPPRIEGFEWEWSRAQFVDLLPELPSYFATDHLLRHLPSGLESFFRMAGCRTCPATMPAMRAFAGRPFVNLQWQRLLAHRLGCREETWEACFGGRAHGERGRSLLDEGRAPGPLDAIRLLGQVDRGLRFGEWHREGVRHLLDEAMAMDLDGLSPLDLMLWREQKLRILEAENLMVASHALAGITLGLSALRRLLGAVGVDDEGTLSLLIARREAGCELRRCLDFEELVAAAHAARLADASLETLDVEALAGRSDLGAFPDLFRRFLREHGHRGLLEDDDAMPRFEDDPRLLLSLLRHRLAGGPPSDLRGRVEGRRFRSRRALERVERSIRERWGRLAGGLGVSALGWILRRIHAHLGLREETRGERLRLASLRRRLHASLARRWVAAGHLDGPEDLHFLGEGEIARACADERAREDLRRRVAKRRAMVPELVAQAVPDRFVGSAPLPQGEPDVLSSLPRLLRGRAASPGLVEGVARWCDEVGDMAALGEGEVLAVSRLDPAWILASGLVSAVVVRRGGWLGHGFVVLRELGVPVVVDVEGLRREGIDGVRLRVDGAAGTVERLEDGRD